MDKLAGSPVLDTLPETRTVGGGTPPQQSHLLRIEGVTCAVCLGTPVAHHICCARGHGGCHLCMLEVRALGSCPLCREDILPALIPNLALNHVLQATAEAPIALAVPARSPSPARKRTRDPEAEAARRRQRADDVAQLAGVLAADPMAGGAADDPAAPAANV